MIEKAPYPPTSRMDSYYVGIGRLSAAWADFELRVNHTIWELANVEQYIGACLTSQFVAPAPRLQALAALCEQRGASATALTELNQLISEARAVAADRNRYVHDPAYASPDNQGDQFYRLQITADKKLIFQMQSGVLQSMARVEQKITSLVLRFYDWKVRTLAAMPAFLRGQFEKSPGVSFGPPRAPDGDPQER